MVPLIARATNAAFILHIFAATDEDGRKLMWTDLRLVLPGERGCRLSAHQEAAWEGRAQTSREITTDAVIREDQ